MSVSVVRHSHLVVTIYVLQTVRSQASGEGLLTLALFTRRLLARVAKLTALAG